MIGTGTISLAAQIAFNMVFAEVTASLGLAAASTITSDNEASAISSISIGSDIEAASNADLALHWPVGIDLLHRLLGSWPHYGEPTNAYDDDPDRSIWCPVAAAAGHHRPISAFAYVVNGTLAIDYITIDFTLGTSMLTPPGSYLGQTFLLGSSEIGVNTGF